MKLKGVDQFMAIPGKKHKVDDFSTKTTLDLTKEEGQEKSLRNIQLLAETQNMLYAHDKYAVLIIFQAMDAAGKDGTIKHVMSGVNPQGCQVFSFKQPSSEELDHDYLWRIYKALPERGRIGIFNRSHYEDVLVTKVHPEYLLKNKLPDIKKLSDVNNAFWERRYNHINDFERSLTENGTLIIKFFLNVSKKEQKKRFLDRLDVPSKNWKFSAADITERESWDKYMSAYSDMLSATSTKQAPWYVIPADNKWFMRYAVGQIICDRLRELPLHYPVVSSDFKEKVEEYKRLLNKREK